MKVKLQKITADAKMPIKGTDSAACFDVHAHSITTKDNDKVVIGLGFKTEIPRGYKGIIVPRSNLTKYGWVMNNSFGVIDSDYRGEWMVIFTPLKSIISSNSEDNTLGNPFPYGVGDRIAQIYFEEVLPIEFELVSELEATERGEDGFGSTGLK